MQTIAAQTPESIGIPIPPNPPAIYEGLIDQYNQPIYPDHDALTAAQDTIRSKDENGNYEIAGVTTPEILRATVGFLGTMATDRCGELIITGNCSTNVDLSSKAIKQTVEDINRQRDLVREYFPRGFYFSRVLSQAAKRRSMPVEIGEDGKPLLKYHGDMVNGRDIKDRAADPKKLVTTANHSQTIYDNFIFSQWGGLKSAHDAHLVAYEEPFIREDSREGDTYLASATLPWLGYSPHNEIDTPQSDLLARAILNPIGIKIGPGNGPGYIKAISEKLNPHGINGKLVFMYRFAHDDKKGMHAAVKAAVQCEFASIHLWDGHGVTQVADNGHKTRKIEHITQGMEELHKSCVDNGVVLHGVNLESNGLSNEEYYECVDSSGEALPRGNAVIDPELNFNQLDFALISLMSIRYPIKNKI